MARPALKFPGGKADEADRILSILKPKLTRDYHEPFCGGASVFFRLQETNPELRFFLSDYNKDLITFYQELAKGSDEFFDTLHTMETTYNTFEDEEDKTDYYYTTRSSFQSFPPAKSAACFLFLNRSTFNGLVRYNSKGGFNAPWGHVDKVSFNFAGLISSSAVLKGVQIEHKSFFDIDPKNYGSESCFLIDPPYLNGFTQYTPSGFTEADHIRLAYTLRCLSEEGAFWGLCGVKSSLYDDLYSGKDFKWHSIAATRSIGCDSDSRMDIEEIFITNY